MNTVIGVIASILILVISLSVWQRSADISGKYVSRETKGYLSDERVCHIFGGRWVRSGKPYWEEFCLTGDLNKLGR